MIPKAPQTTAGRLRTLSGRGLRRGRRLAGRGLRFGRRLARRALLVGPHALGWVYLAVATGRRERGALRLREWRERAGRGAAFEPPPRPTARPFGRRPRVLLVSPFPLWPADHGGAVRIVNLIRRIAERVDLHLFLFSRAADDGPQARALATDCAGIHFHDWRPARQHDFWGLDAPGPALFRSYAVAERMREIVTAERIDVVQLEYTEMGQYASAVRGLPTRTILTEIDVAFRSRQRRLAAGFHRRYDEDGAFGTSRADCRRLMRFELAATAAVDQVHVMSAADGEFLASYLADGARRLRVVPNGVDTARLQPPPPGTPRQGVLFLGNFQHLPNLDACDHLMAEIWPRVRARRPEARLTVVGAHAPERLRRWDGRDGIEVVGAVPEVLPYYQRYRLLVAPIRAGSGTRLKILEAMACELPVVSTSLGAEGIDARAGEHLLIADSPGQIADAVERLLADDDLRDRLAASGRRLVEAGYDWDASADRLLECYRELLPEPDRFPVEEADARPRGDPEISVIIPTRDGGEPLARTLAAVCGQRCSRSFETICVDSESQPEGRAILDRHPVRVETIARSDFNHGLTRDLGAGLARGEVLVFLNQDATPADDGWLERLTAPLFAGDRRSAAVQGGIREWPDANGRFYWNSSGHRFYFTRETERWLARFGGIGFSTVNAALRREAWAAHPFGAAAIMEDKKWQREVVGAGYKIVDRPDAFVFHTHDYDFGWLVSRCVSEGFGWRALGEPYRLRDLLFDLARPRIYADLARGLARGRIRSVAELLFPWLRPLMLYRGSRFARGIQR